MDYKKMIAVAGALVCAAAVAEGITSDNVVGYAQSDLTDGNVLVAPQFLALSGEGYDIQKLSVTGTAVDMYSVSIQTLTTNGKAKENFIWNDYDYSTPCWENDETFATSRTFQPGEAVWVQGKTGYGLQSSGAVGTSDVIIALANGNVAIGNPFPIAIDIQDIVVTATDMYGVSIQTLTANGKAKENFIWNDYDYATPCWENDETFATSRTFQPGEGVWVQGKLGDTLRIPAPTL